MKKLVCMVALAGCGTEQDEHVSGTASALEKCLIDGGSLEELWSVNNQHGPITSVVASSLIVVGSADGSVKQWSFDGDDPVYGSPFTTEGDEVGAVALTDDGHVVAATLTAQVVEWRLRDAVMTGSGTIPDTNLLSAIAVRPDGAQIVTGGSDLYVLEPRQQPPVERLGLRVCARQSVVCSGTFLRLAASRAVRRGAPTRHRRYVGGLAAPVARAQRRSRCRRCDPGRSWRRDRLRVRGR
jgi:hypothetical protein